MKNNLKKAIAMLLALVLSMSLVACEGIGLAENEIKVGDYIITIDEFAYYYYLVWENYESNAYQYDLLYGEKSGFKEFGYDYTKLPENQEYKDDYSKTNGVEIADLGVEKPTWKDVFVRLAIDSIIQVKHGVSEANRLGLTLGEAEKSEIENAVNSMKASAEEVNLSFEDYMREKYGSSLNEEEYRSLYEESYLLNLAVESAADEYMSQVTEDERIAEYESDKTNYDNYGETIVSDVRHILVSFPKNSETGEILTPSENEKLEYLVRAQKILDLYNENPTEENFVKLVKEYSEDEGSVVDGGLFTKVANDQRFVAEFTKWSVASERRTGDVEIIETEYGYHIMYFAKSYGDAKQYLTTRAVAEDKYNDVFFAATNEQLTKLDVRNEKITERADEQDKIFNYLLASEYKKIEE